ncbi:MAG: hypothetical protein SFV53_02685 [Rickettsiales bacterium]|nr:hypothetical protein [Rickettsiales bacterium]
MLEVFFDELMRLPRRANALPRNDKYVFFRHCEEPQGDAAI